MGTITKAQLAHIKTLLTRFAPSDHLSPFENTEQNDAKTYLLSLVEQHDNEGAGEALNIALARFFRIRVIVNPTSKETHADMVSAYLYKEKALAIKSACKEEEASAAMLREIFLINNLERKKPAKKITDLNELENSSIQSNNKPTLPQKCYYQLTSDAATSLEKLYEHTDGPVTAYSYNSLLLATIECDAIDLLKKLVAKIDNKANPRVQYFNVSMPHSPLTFAATLNKNEAIGILIAAGANVNAAPERGITALSCALKQDTRSPKTIAALLAAENIELTKDHCTIIWHHRNAEILSLLIKNHLDTLNQLLFQGASVQQWAVENESLDTLNALAEHNKINFDEKYAGNHTILHLIAKNNWHQTAEKLTIQNKHLLALNNATFTPAIEAIRARHFNIASIFLKDQWTQKEFIVRYHISHFAAYAGWKYGVEQCIANDIDINALQNTGTSRMLTVAIANSKDAPEYQDVVRLLLNTPAITETINIKDDNHTPLGWAIKENCPNITALLVAHKDINLDEKFEGKTIFQVAEEKANTIPAWKKVIETLNTRKPLSVATALAQPSNEGMIATLNQTIALLKEQLKEQDHLIKEQKKQLQEKDTTIANLSTSLITVTALLGKPASTSPAEGTRTLVTLTSEATTITQLSANTDISGPENDSKRPASPS